MITFIYIEFGRHCLPNLPAQIELSHLNQILPREPSAEACAQIHGKALQQLFAIEGMPPAFLFAFHDVSAYFPVGLGHAGVDGPGGVAPCGMNQINHSGKDAAVPIICFAGPE
jgi:hypothetical protein